MHAYSVVVQDSMRQPDVAICFMQVAFSLVIVVRLTADVHNSKLWRKSIKIIKIKNVLIKIRSVTIYCSIGFLVSSTFNKSGLI
jgi:hypothetical protein